MCGQGWPPEVLVPSLLEALHGVIPSARNLFDWTDEEGRLLRYFIEGPVDAELARHYFEHFHNRKEAACMPAFATLRDQPAGVRSASELSHKAFFASDLYNEVWRPQGMHTRIEGVVRSDRGKLLGSLVLYRGPGDRPFTTIDEGLLAALLPAVARALEAGGRLATAPQSAPGAHVRGREPDETLLLDLQGRLLNASPGAQRLLMLADGGLSHSALTEPVADRVMRVLGSLVEQAVRRAAEEAASAVSPLQPWPSRSIFSAYGRFDAHATLLRPMGGCGAGAGLLQIVLARLESRDVALQRVLRDLPISVGQAHVCAALYAGRSQIEIAQSLRIAPCTVIDHVRKAYRALEVTGTAELRALLDRQVNAPTKQKLVWPVAS